MGRNNNLGGAFLPRRRKRLEIAVEHGLERLRRLPFRMLWRK
jgi:heme oxygenase